MFQQTTHEHTGNTLSSIFIASMNTRCKLRTNDVPCFNSFDSDLEYRDLPLTSPFLPYDGCGMSNPKSFISMTKRKPSNRSW